MDLISAGSTQPHQVGRQQDQGSGGPFLSLDMSMVEMGIEKAAEVIWATPDLNVEGCQKPPLEVVVYSS